jgi:Ca2+-binding RTX toxin-like protein
MTQRRDGSPNRTGRTTCPKTSLSNSSDTFHGTIWNDIIFGNDGNDTIHGDWGYDQICGGQGNDVLDGSIGNDLLMGQEGDDLLITSDSAEMHGGTGNDTYRIIAGGSHKPKLVEKVGEGIDTVLVSIWRGESYTLGDHLENLTVQDYRWVDGSGTDYYVATKLIGNGLANVITGGGLADALYGGGGNVTLRGGGSSDNLFGGAGNDSLDGGTGADRMAGGTENDTYRVDTAGDLVVEFAGQGIDTVQTVLATYSLTAHVENLQNVGTAKTFTGYGNALDNRLTGLRRATTCWAATGQTRSCSAPGGITAGAATATIPSTARRATTCCRAG